MTRRVRFTPLFAVGALAAGLLAAAPPPARAGEVPFAPPGVISASAAGSRSVFAADVDGDGDTDVLSASSADDTIAWYENDGSHSFVPHTITTGADGALSVFAADVDGDGDTDVLSASSGDNTIAWYENDGSQRFSTHSISTRARGAFSVFAADVDGDGDTDVLSASYTDDSVAWYENDGSQSFATHTITTAANEAFSVFAADVDGDGDTDVLSASYADGKVAWYENDGSQSFTTRTITTAALGAYAVFAADVDGDGDTDVLAASFYGNEVAWYENDGAQNFTAHTISTKALGARSVSAADVDGDGDIDVLSASAFDDTVAWYENDGSQHFTARTVTTSADNARSVFAADVDGDGDTDVLSASSGDDEVAWYENLTIHRSAVFPRRSVITSGADGARAVFAADVDGDGDTDVLSASRYDDTIAWYENDGSQSFAARTITTTAVRAYSVFAADVDGDGDTDVLSASRYDDTVAWYENDGSQSFAARIISTAAFRALSVFAADVDGDGDTDVLSASRNDGKVAWYENDGSQNFTTRTITTAAGGASSVFAADVDGDGDTDVIACASFDGAVAWYENDGSQTFSTRIITTAASGAQSVFAADVDGDGDTDVLSASRNDDKVAWYENDGSQGFTTRTITTAADDVRSVAAADVDGDGDIDVLSASRNDDTVAWYENDGSQSFTTRTITTAAARADSVFAADMDGDGDIDVLSASRNDDAVAWYENEGGQFSLATTDLTPPRSIEGATDVIFRIDAAHRGRGGDADVELATLDLLFEAAPGTPLTTSQANALIDSLHVYLDDGSGLFEPGSDPPVTTLETLTLSGGRQAVSFADGDPNVRVALGAPRSYFVVADLTADARLQDPDNFRITHVTSSTSTGEDADHDIPLSLEFAEDTPSAVVEVNDPPVAMADADSLLEDTTQSWSAPGVLANDVDEDLDELTVTALTAVPAHAAFFVLNPDGSFSYTPRAHFSGSDSFQYRAGDGLSESGVVTVALTIDPVADPPSLVVSDASGVVDTPIPLAVSVELVDTDGSEVLWLVAISSVPSGASLSAGSDVGGGLWHLGAEQLAGLTITPPPGSGGDFTLTVTATALETFNFDDASSSASLSVTVDPEADIEVALDDGGGVVMEGGELTYTIAVTNLGPGDVLGATVTDTFPVELTDVSWTCAASAGSTCGLGGVGNLSTLADLLAGGTATYTVTSVAPPSQSAALVNTASAAVPAGVIDPVPGNDSATVETIVALFADGFESGSTVEWSSTVPAPALPLIVPNRATREPRVYRGSVRIGPGLLGEGAPGGEATRLVLVSEAEGAPYRFGIAVTRTAGGHRIRGWVPSGEDGTQQLTRPAVLTGPAPELSFEWIAASGPGASDGSLRLFADGRPAGSLEGLSAR